MRLINKKNYNCLETEFTEFSIQGFENLKLVNDLNLLERIVGLINDLLQDLEIDYFYTDNHSHDNFIERNVIPLNNEDEVIMKSCVQYINNNIYIQTLNVETYGYSIQPLNLDIYITYKLTNTDICVNVSKELHDKFLQYFRYYIPEGSNGEFDYDNLIHLVVMVKNGGEEFQKMLQHNINIFDRYTILDTGSTDNTVSDTKKLLVNKKGNVFETVFVNFRDTRNMSLNMAGNNCKYILILDDTYFVNGDIRKLLNSIRSDQYADSYSIYIKDDFSLYASNRLIKSDRNLRYIHRIHEVIEHNGNISIVLPENSVYIYDLKNDKMNKRTTERLQLDLQLLFQDLEDNAHDERSYYYLGQTYNLLGDNENAYKSYMKRTEFKNSGFRQELIDAYINAYVIGKYKLNMEWNAVKDLLFEAFGMEKERPEAPFYIGLYYYENNDMYNAYQWFKKAFEIGLPTHCQFSLKPIISYCHVPKLLAELCYNYNDYELGLKACELFLLQRNNINDPYVEEYNPIIETMYVNYMKLVKLKKNMKPIISDKRILCIVADGGFKKWSGSSIEKEGVGGSETWVIETATSMHKLYGNYFNVIVFCNCDKEETYKNVNYYHLDKYPDFISEYYVDTCIISRYSEYLPLTYKGYSENVYLICHDLTPSNNFFFIEEKLKNIFCLTEYHVEYMKDIYKENKQVTDLLVSQNYGVNRTETVLNKLTNQVNFIFSSFANRGLYQVLKMWKEIHSLNSNSHLYIYCDLNNKWLNDNYGELVILIKELLVELLKENLNIHLQGWVSKDKLNKAFQQSHIWLYPCTFLETFCLTALECAINKVLPITNGIGALQNTADKGIIIEGDVNSNEWKEQVLEVLKDYFNDSSKYDKYIDNNYKWASNMTWDNQTKILFDRYILRNRLEYKNMFNWTTHLSSIKDFTEIIDYFNNKVNLSPIQILEIGSWTGTSICALVKNIKNSYGTAVDMWENYLENDATMYVKDLQVKESCLQNIKIYNLEDRIELIQGDSKSVLIDLMKINMNYDLIYVDGSHKLIDVIVDLYLSWSLLKKNGIMIIDDYLFNINKLNYDNKHIIDTIKYSVDSFLKNIQGQYKLLKMNYRVFLQKI